MTKKTDESLLNKALYKAGDISKLSIAIKISKTAIYKLLNKETKSMRIATRIKIKEFLKDENR